MDLRSSYYIKPYLYSNSSRDNIPVQLTTTSFNPILSMIILMASSLLSGNL